MSENEEKIQRSVYLTKEEFDYLKNKGISIAKFMCQAIKTNKSGEWQYDYNPKSI